MHIAVLSGKGGTGKTTVSTNLAAVMNCRYVDCDVEEPNGFIFLRPYDVHTKDVSVSVPVIDKDKCKGCQKCVDICQFNALVYTRKGLVLFEKLCHACGACMLVCPGGAIAETERSIGKIDIGKTGSIECVRGVLDVGEPMSGPIIRELKKNVDSSLTLWDCSPGSSCNVVKSMSDCDFALLVTEPTKFGLHDLRIAVELTRKLSIPFAVVINRSDQYSGMIYEYCSKENIKILGEIPFDRSAAVAYSKGELLYDKPPFKDIFLHIAGRLKEEVLCS